jgi:hypothetical protein
MRVEPDFRKRIGETRRYFPDWTHRSLASGPELEADHNSYLAGGYGEEFGYTAQPGYSRGAPVLEDETPELCRERRIQAQSTHPGYPLRPHPFADNRDRAARDWHTSARARNARQNSTGRSQDAGGIEHHGSFISVSNRLHAREHGDARTRAAIITTRVAAALVALRWALRRLRDPVMPRDRSSRRTSSRKGSRS